MLRPYRNIFTRILGDLPVPTFAMVDGITLHYKLEGVPNGVPLVFCNSLGSDFRIWDQVVPAFTDQFAVLRYDKRGHGLSDAPPGPYTIHDHAEDLAGLLATLNLNAAVLIGISVGGMIALDFAIHYSARVKALVLCDTGAKIGTPEYWNERAENVRKAGLAPLVDTIVGRWFTADFPRQHPAEYRGYHNFLSRVPTVGYTATCEALRDGDLRASLGSIQAKALVLCGDQDAVTTPALARELADGLKNARLELIANAAHLPCLEQPGVMAAKIQQFLKESGDVR